MVQVRSPLGGSDLLQDVVPHLLSETQLASLRIKGTLEISNMRTTGIKIEIKESDTMIGEINT